MIAKLVAWFNRLGAPEPTGPSVCACCFRHQNQAGAISTISGRCRTCTEQVPPMPREQPVGPYLFRR